MYINSIELIRSTADPEDSRAAPAVVLCTASAAVRALKAHHHDQHPIPLPLGHAQLVAMFAESPLTEDISGVGAPASEASLWQEGTPA